MAITFPPKPQIAVGLILPQPSPVPTPQAGSTGAFLPPTPPQLPAHVPQRDERGRYLAGTSGNPTGRPKSLGEMRKLCRDLGTQGVQVLWEIANDKDEKGQARVQAISVLLERGYGKAVQPVEIGAPGAFDDMTDAELDALAQNTARKVIDLTVVTDEDPE